MIIFNLIIIEYLVLIISDKKLIINYNNYHYNSNTNIAIWMFWKLMQIFWIGIGKYITVYVRKSR